MSPVARSAGDRLRAFRDSRFEIAANAIQLFFGNERSHVAGGIHSGADVNVAGMFRDAVHDFVENIAFDVESRARAAALAVIEENGAGGAGDGGIDIGIVQHDVGRFSAQFERNFLQIAGSGLQDQFADFRRAGERDFVDIRMSRQRSARRLAVARHDIHHAVGNAGFLNQFAKQQRGERRLLRGLQHDRAAGRKSRAELPRRHQQREIPRNDLPDDADRLANRVGQKLCCSAARRNGNRVSFDLGGPAGHVAEQIGREGHVGDARDRERLAVVERFELREFFQVLFDQIRRSSRSCGRARTA